MTRIVPTTGSPTIFTSFRVSVAALDPSPSSGTRNSSSTVLSQNVNVTSLLSVDWGSMPSMVMFCGAMTAPFVAVDPSCTVVMTTTVAPVVRRKSSCTRS